MVRFNSRQASRIVRETHAFVGHLTLMDTQISRNFDRSFSSLCNSLVCACKPTKMDMPCFGAGKPGNEAILDSDCEHWISIFV